MTGLLNVTKFNLVPNFFLLIFNPYVVGGEIGCRIPASREKATKTIVFCCKWFHMIRGVKIICFF